MLIFILLFASNFASAGAPSMPWPMANPERLMADINVLAQPEWEGRKSGTEGNRFARQWIIDQYQAIGLKPAGKRDSYSSPFHCALTRHERGVNLLGRLGPEPSEKGCVLIGAHYDAKGWHDGELVRGADDNASGVAGMLEIARHFKEREAELSMCVLFAAWDFEEGDLSTGGAIIGSRAWTSNPSIPLNQIVLSLTFDLIGGDFFPGVESSFYVFGTESSESVAKLVDNMDASPLVARPVSVDIIEPAGALMPRSDYAGFRDNGVPYLFITTGTGHYYHRGLDVPEVIRTEKLARITEYSRNLVWSIVTGRALIETRAERIPRRWRDRDESIATLEQLLVRGSEHDPRTPHFARLRDRLENNLKVLRALRERGEEPQLCELQNFFIDLVEAVGGLSRSRAGLGRLFATCPFELPF